MPKIDREVTSTTEVRTEAANKRSPFQIHCDRWRGSGCGAAICAGADKKCVARGRVPCDVLFVGEGPGESEDVLGQPFVGPAGKLLDHVVEQSVGEHNLHCTADGIPGLSWAFTNLVLCIPRDADGGKATEPGDDSVRACAPRLVEFVHLVARPRLIVCVGALSRDWLDVRAHHNVWRVVEVITDRKRREKLGRGAGPYRCSVCGAYQFLSPGGYTCVGGHDGADGVPVPIIDIKHPAAVLRENVTMRGLSIQRCVVQITSAVDDLVRG